MDIQNKNTEFSNEELTLLRTIKNVDKMYGKSILRDVFKNLAFALETKSLSVSSWTYNVICSTIERYAGIQNRKTYTDVEIMASKFFRSLYGNGASRFLEVNLAIPTRSTVTRRLELASKGTTSLTPRIS